MECFLTLWSVGLSRDVQSMPGLATIMTFVFVFLLGNVLGSFLNVCVYRLPQHESLTASWHSLISPPSHCPFCLTPILRRDNLPILGWLLLKGRCRTCRHKIPSRYPLIELFNGIMLVVLYACIVPQGIMPDVHESCLYANWSAWGRSEHMRGAYGWLWWHLHYAYLMVLMESLLVASLIDLDLRIIPDSVTLPAMLVGLLGSLTGCFWLAPVWYAHPTWSVILWSLWTGELTPPAWWMHDIPPWMLTHPVLHGLLVSVVGWFVGGGIIWFLRVTGTKIFGREAMGFGDVILMATIGSFLGWQACVIVFFLAPACAIVVMLLLMLLDTVKALRGQPLRWQEYQEIPYGPYLSMAALLVVLLWKQWSAATQHLFGLGLLLPLIAAMLAGMLVVILWLVHSLKRLLGWNPETWQEQNGEWTSADQLAFFANQNPQDSHDHSRSSRWPGERTGRGEWYHDSWYRQHEP